MAQSGGGGGQPIPDRVVVFDLSDPGISRDVEFGVDTAWPSEQNVHRSVLFMGADQIDIVRASFQLTFPLVNGNSLTAEQLNDLYWRLYLIDAYVGPNKTLN